MIDEVVVPGTFMPRIEVHLGIWNAPMLNKCGNYLPIALRKFVGDVGHPYVGSGDYLPRRVVEVRISFWPDVL